MGTPKGDICNYSNESSIQTPKHDAGNCRKDHSNNQLNRKCMRSVVNLEEVRRNRITLHQIINLRQEKIFEQQCEIEELRRRIKEVCHENRFLREQNFWQAKALDKLDGKHAELPQIINGHLEEVRILREQIKRNKEMLKVEKQARHDAEVSRQRTLNELKHLRKLAEEQKLLEREELMQTIEKLQAESVEREKLLMNLEKYSENLEKNQRFESFRLTKSEKKMRQTCQSLIDKIHALEQTIQEKQKIIELSNIYAKRNMKQGRLDSQADISIIHEAATDTSTAATDSLKCNFRDRIREFDLKRQSMERIKCKTNNMLVSSDYTDNDDGNQKVEPESNTSNKISMAPPCILTRQGNEIKHFKKKKQTPQLDHPCVPVTQRPQSTSHLVVLPRLKTDCNGRKYSPLNNVDQLRDNEGLSCDHSKPKEWGSWKTPPFRTNSNYKTSKEFRDSKNSKTTPDIQNSKSIKSVKSPDHPCKFDVPPSTDSYKSVGIIANLIQHISPRISYLSFQEAEILPESISQIRAERSVRPMEVESPHSKATITQNISQSAQSHLVSKSYVDDQDSLSFLPICRPSGDQELDKYLEEDTTGHNSTATSSDIGVEDDEPKHSASPSGFLRTAIPSLKKKLRIYRGPHGFVVNAISDCEGVEVEYVSDSDSAMKSKLRIKSKKQTLR